MVGVKKKLIGVILINYLFKKNIIDILKYYKKIKNKKFCAVNRNCRNNFLIIAVKKKVFFFVHFSNHVHIIAYIMCARKKRVRESEWEKSEWNGYVRKSTFWCCLGTIVEYT